MWFPIVSVALFVVSLWSGSHFWRTICVSWLASVSVSYYVAANYGTLSTFEFLWAFSLCATLVLWSILLTPVQLLFSKREERKPTTAPAVLWDPAESTDIKRASIRADIVAVHGLGSNCDRTWLAYRSKANWLADFLPRTHANFRVIALNHDSRWDAYSPVQSLRDYGQIILDSIATLRRDEEENKRPLIFIGHSFGGILIKKALVIARGSKILTESLSDARERAVYDACCGVLFFGTPHRGSNFALFGMLSSYFSYWRGSRSDLLEFLTPSSKELDDLHLSFLRAYETIYIANFFETVPIKLLGLPFHVVVTKESATIDGKPSISVDADHRSLQRCENDFSGNYLQIVHQINMIVEHLNQQRMIEHQRNKYTVPFRLRGAPLVSVFVGRTNELQQIEEGLELALLQSSNRLRLKIVVLQGMGGVGKSQLAIEYAIRHQGVYSAIFWCNGKTEALLRLELAAIAEQIPLKGVLGSNGKILKDEVGLETAITAVFDWLSETHNTKWLIIVDNVDTQRAVILSAEGSTDTSYNIWKHFPRHGSLLITSRLASLRRIGKGVEIREVSTQDGLQILCNATGGDTKDREAAIIVEKLQGLPLAIAQAGAYIYEMSITPKKYLDSYEARTRDILTQHNDITYVNGSIMATLQISYDAVKSRNPSAFKLLTTWGFLDNSDVWWDLFHLAWKCKAGFAEPESDLPSPDVVNEQTGQNDSSKNNTSSWLTDLAKDESLFNKAISTLREFYFVRRNEARDSLSIHPVVHQWLRQRLDSGSWHANLSATITLLGRAVPYAHFEEPWILQRRLAVHVDNCLEILEQAKADKVDSPEGFQGLAILMFDQGRFERAEGLYRRAAQGWERRRGFDYWQTRRAYHDLGLAYRTLGKYDEAEALWKHLLDACMRIEGTTDCRLLDDLGRLFTMTRRYEEAETHFERALAGREDRLRDAARAAPNEPLPLDLELFVADSSRHFGILKRAQLKFEEAESLFRRSLGTFQKRLGPTHTWTLLAIADLGDISQARGQQEQAEMYLKNALVGMEEQLGESHNYTVKIYRDLGELVLAMGRRKDALVLLEKAAKGLGIARGEDNAVAKEARERVRIVMDMDGGEHEMPTPSSHN
ncbi:hypothetical protein MMC07_008718 [Pseudocyphellaria aurata]|nr:hypothetical protein [Pseudocyphellaria aurata]